jgi:hypothetical protein
MLAVAACYLRRAGDDWPVDVGDDPSCRHAASTGGVITWGVCRPDVRNELEAKDLVIFFAVDRLGDRRPARYAWVGYATVARKVSQREIFERDELAPLRQYPNLLIRPHAMPETYEHFEPALHRNEWHKDWLWRLTHNKRRKKRDFEEAERSNRYSVRDTRAAGSLITLAQNYILFEPEGAGTWIARDPPVIAHAEMNGATEAWVETDLARDLHAIVFEGLPSRTTLRTTNEQTAHPEVRLGMADTLRERLERLVSLHSVLSR